LFVINLNNNHVKQKAMEKYIIIGYAVLLAILFDGSTGRQNTGVAPRGNLTVYNSHPVYSDSRTGIENSGTHLTNVSADHHIHYR
jgi:hypothetical protein